MSRSAQGRRWPRDRPRPLPRLVPARLVRAPRPRPRSKCRGCDANFAAMSELPDSFDPEACARYLREIGASGSPVLPIGEAALALAAFERPRVGFARYLQHLAAIARDVGRHAGAPGDLQARAQ